MCEIITANGMLTIGDPAECYDPAIYCSIALQNQHPSGMETESKDSGIILEEDAENSNPILTNWMKYREIIKEKFLRK